VSDGYTDLVVGDNYVIEFFYNNGANSIQIIRPFEFTGTLPDGTKHQSPDVTLTGWRCNRRGDNWAIGYGTGGTSTESTDPEGWLNTLQTATGTCWFEINPQ